MFIDINTNQKGVPVALLLDIKQVAERESADEKALREIFDKLNVDSESPLCGYLSSSSSVSGKISRVAFNRGVKTVLANNVMSRLPSESQYTLLKNYFKAIEGCLRGKKLLFKAIYFEAFCDLFNDVMNTSRNLYQNYKFESLDKVLNPLRATDIEQMRINGKTKLSKTDISGVLKAILHDQVQVSEDMI